MFTVEKERNSDDSEDEESEEAAEGAADGTVYPHKCPKCSKSFKLLSNLIKHKKVGRGFMYCVTWRLPLPDAIRKMLLFLSR